MTRTKTARTRREGMLGGSVSMFFAPPRKETCVYRQCEALVWYIPRYICQRQTFRLNVQPIMKM